MTRKLNVPNLVSANVCVRVKFQLNIELEPDNLIITVYSWNYYKHSAYPVYHPSAVEKDFWSSWFAGVLHALERCLWHKGPLIRLNIQIIRYVNCK
jgi:hypothetical protein